MFALIWIQWQMGLQLQPHWTAITAEGLVILGGVIVPRPTPTTDPPGDADAASSSAAVVPFDAVQHRGTYWVVPSAGFPLGKRQLSLPLPPSRPLPHPPTQTRVSSWSLHGPPCVSLIRICVAVTSTTSPQQLYTKYNL